MHVFFLSKNLFKGWNITMKMLMSSLEFNVSYITETSIAVQNLGCTWRDFLYTSLLTSRSNLKIVSWADCTFWIRSRRQINNSRFDINEIWDFPLSTYWSCKINNRSYYINHDDYHNIKHSDLFKNFISFL